MGRSDLRLVQSQVTFQAELAQSPLSRIRILSDESASAAVDHVYVATVKVDGPIARVKTPTEMTFLDPTLRSGSFPFPSLLPDLARFYSPPLPSQTDWLFPFPPAVCPILLVVSRRTCCCFLSTA